MHDTPPFRIRALGEIALRVADMPAMVAFYTQTLGLEVMAGGPDAAITFLGIADGYQGHTTVLALFDATTAPRPTDLGPRAAGALHHIALTVPRGEQDAAIQWYDQIGQPYRIETFAWVGWRGVFTTDPEGNTVELVAYDAALLDTADS